ncbi:MAG TPA: hypothetical protein VL693_15300 [Vicinamibacterales bacterium]|jgi:hypothetical protein|nr:hypothetical protein [Vicinamibacterales bacterium]
MNRIRAVIAMTVFGIAVAMLVHTNAQNRVTTIGGGGTPLVPDSQVNGPVPRMPDGHPDLSGPWLGGGSNADIEREGGLKPGELPLLPWAKQLRDGRKEQDEPYVACTPMSVPRINPFPWKMVYSLTPKGITEIYILHELGDAGAHRVIYMDGRKHPDARHLFPTWYGHSIGHWEGDTLVIDTVGYNDKFWFDSRGTPHTEQLHTIERFSRPNFGTLINDFTLEDPGAYSRPVKLQFTARRVRQDVELMEDICTEDNQAGIAGGYKLNPNNEQR